MGNRLNEEMNSEGKVDLMNYKEKESYFQKTRGWSCNAVVKWKNFRPVPFFKGKRSKMDNQIRDGSFDFVDLLRTFTQPFSVLLCICARVDVMTGLNPRF
jgi:hypothetical protein